MNLIQKDNGFILTYKGQEFINHTIENSFIWVGKGNATYIMERGSFVINEELEYKKPLQVTSIEMDKGKYKIVLKTMDLTQGFDIYATEDDNKLKMEFRGVFGDINRVWFNLKSTANEHVYGCGETFTHFDLKGQNVAIWVAEHQNLKRIEKKFDPNRNGKPMDFQDYETYYAQPTFVSSEKYFLHVDSDAYMEFDFTNKDKHCLQIREIPSKIIIGKNNDFEGVLENLTGLLGRQPELPNWVYDGVMLGMQGGTDIILNKLNNALDKGLKVTALWCQDWQGRRITEFGKQLMWNWEWDQELYPNLDNVIKELREKNIRFMGYINPFLAIEKDLYKEASAKGYTVKNKNGEDYFVTITTFPAAMIDLTNPEAFNWIKQVIKKNMIEFGLSGWMADFGEYLPVDAVLYSGEDAQKVHNTWPAIWAKANMEAIEEAGKLGEIVFFTRAGHTGTVKHSTLMWTGDQHVDWSLDDGLPSVIPASLSLAMSGYGITHSDIGGYTTLYDLKRTPELFKRWAEHSAFTPVMRNHEGNRPDSNIQFDCDDDTLKHYARMVNVYRTLAPYIKDVVRQNSMSGVPAMRPLFMYYNEEKAFESMYEYLLGRDLLVAPVIKENQSTWDVYLPEDEWVHLWTGNEYAGGNVTVEARMGYPPVFFRKETRYSEVFNKVSQM